MEKRLMPIIIAVVVIILVFGIYQFILPQDQTLNPSPTPTPTQNISPTSTNVSPTLTGAAKVNMVKIYLIALEDDGKSGEKIGCGDSVVSIDKTITPTEAPLRAAYEELLKIKDQNVGEYYNSLYQSNLKVDSINLKDGKAVINLTGTHQLSGVCDNPRFEAQLTKTAFQFPTVKEVEININGKPLKDILSLM